VSEPPDALFEIGRNDGEKLDPLEQRMTRVAGFFQNAVLKRQEPAVGVEKPDSGVRLNEAAERGG
jgi:hypothetical protein